MKKWINQFLVVLFLFGVGMLGLGSAGYCYTKKREQLFTFMVNASVRLAGHGSGVFINDGVILTAAHCLENVNTITIELSDGTILESRDFYIDDEEDVGFVFVNANELCIAKVTLSKSSLGDIVYLVGGPFDDIFKFSLTKGILSHLDRNIPRWNWKNLLQTDAEGGPGSSGGPLYNSDGQLIGMYVGHAYKGGIGISLCEDAKSILEAYERCVSKRTNK